jgi:hypothetical protein
MPKFEHCGKEILDPFVCSCCRKAFCFDHILSEDHQRDYLSYVKELVTREKASKPKLSRLKKLGLSIILLTMTLALDTFYANYQLGRKREPIDVVMCTWNSNKFYFRKCLLSIKKEVDVHHFIVIDRFPSDGTLEVVRSVFPDAKIFQTYANLRALYFSLHCVYKIFSFRISPPTSRQITTSAFTRTSQAHLIDWLP